MSSPAKRRKTDKDVSNVQRPARSLEYFFGKPPPNAVDPSGSEHASSQPLPASQDEISEALTDEELARKLQAQWDQEEQAERSAADATQLNGHWHEQDSQQMQEETQGCTKAGSHAIEQGSEEAPVGSPSNPQPHSATLQSHTLSLQSATATEDTVTPTIPFDQSPLTFEPTKYLPYLKRQWDLERAGGATYALLTRCFVLVNSTQSRIKIVDNIVNLLRIIIEGDPQSLIAVVWLTVNSISPPYIDMELGLGGSAISKALKKVCGLDNAGLKTLYNKHGDAGDVAFEAKKRQSLTLRKPKPLTIRGVFDSLVKIANSKGHGSQEAKQRIVERLVQDSRGAEESRYIVRTLVQHLRIGAVKTTMLIALSRAFLLSRSPEASFEVKDQTQLAKLKKDQIAEIWGKSEEIVKACFARRPNYNDLVAALLEIGVCDELLVRCGLALHVPLRPMLGNITRDLGEMLTKLQGRDFGCEFKYDGQRAQVHCDERGKVTIFSRHLEVMTEKYPDLVALVPKIAGDGVSSFIMEGEVVAIDHETGDLKTFQTLANRARKDVELGAVKVGVCLFAFDLMYLNGQDLLERPFRERRGLLRSLFTEVPHRFTWVKSIDATSNDSETVLDFFKSATEIKCEGIMVKVLDNVPNPDLEAQLDDGAAPTVQPPTPAKSKRGTKVNSKTQGVSQETSLEKASTRRKALVSTYEPDKRVDSWLKVKKDYAASSDTLDLIPIGAWHGQGRKAAWWSPILLAVRNPETGCLEAVTKCISGFTDKFYKDNKEKYAQDGENVVSRPSWVEYGGEPDVWFSAQEVWEIAFADITLSPTYTAAIGLVSEERGLSTRFPRFLKVREDKSIEEATTSDYLATLWRQQEARVAKEGGSAAAGEVAPDGDVEDE